MAPFVLIFTLLFASSAGARVEVPVVGVWVSAEARQALEAGEQRALGCYLTIDERPLEVRETCDGVERAWPRVRLSAMGATGLQIRSPEPAEEGELVRTLISRPGAPDELEVRIQAPGGAREFRRLYRLDERRLDALETVELVQRRLVGRWNADDGGALAFLPDGTYTFHGERGTFRVEAGFETEAGAWGALFLEPEDGQRRRYLLHGAGWRIGLAEVPRDVELRLPSDVEPEDPAEEVVEGAAADDPWSDRGAEGLEADEPTAAPHHEAPELVHVGGVAIPLPRRAPAKWAVVGFREVEPEVTLWLTRQAEDAQAVEARDADGLSPEGEAILAEAEEEEPPPIAQPIVPAKRRVCGCGAAEGALALVLLVPAWRRKRCT